MLGKAVIPDWTSITSKKDTPNYIFNNTFQYSDGNALYTITRTSFYSNNLFEYNDWTGANNNNENTAAVACFSSFRSKGDTYSNNTMSYCG